MEENTTEGFQSFLFSVEHVWRRNAVTKSHIVNLFRRVIQDTQCPSFIFSGKRKTYEERSWTTRDFISLILLVSALSHWARLIVTCLPLDYSATILWTFLSLLLYCTTSWCREYFLRYFLKCAHVPSLSDFICHRTLSDQLSQYANDYSRTWDRWKGKKIGKKFVVVALRVTCTCDTVTARENGSFLTEMETNSTPSVKAGKTSPRTTFLVDFYLFAACATLVTCLGQEISPRLAGSTGRDQINQWKTWLHLSGKGTLWGAATSNNRKIIFQLPVKSTRACRVFSIGGGLLSLIFCRTGSCPPPRYFGRESVGAALVVRLSLISREASDLLVADPGHKTT